MTLEEKAKRIENHCNNVEVCETCPLFSEDTEFCYAYTYYSKVVADAVINHNYRVLFGES